ncbi:MAG: 1-deoxy-D-xylulose-5-phosphate reductoisomerase [Parachlamydiales bacterium]|jgi:1-deoxy-D-xylulose-5-phosphate reductoisomerase
MRDIVILGSTGSIGKSTLAIAKHLGKDKIRVRALAAQNNIDELARQIEEFHPEVVAVYKVDKAEQLQKRFPSLEILSGQEGINAVAGLSGKPLVISAISGTLGLQPTLAAIEAGNEVALANKEALVSGGELLTKLAKKHKVNILPLDSEHNAIFQCIQGIKHTEIKKLIVTASGGPFLKYDEEQLRTVTPESALKHPNWSMGPKVTIDCSTLMNKGLEVIEAHWIFDIPLDRIEVVIHPQSIVHSMVETVDNSILAQLSPPDMRLPIQYALTYPHRIRGITPSLDFSKMQKLEFYPPDTQKFRCLSLAYDALRSGKSYPCYMNAANEILVGRFLKGEIPWNGIALGITDLMAKHSPIAINSVQDVLFIDEEARRHAECIKFT